MRLVRASAASRRWTTVRQADLGLGRRQKASIVVGRGTAITGGCYRVPPHRPLPNSASSPGSASRAIRKVLVVLTAPRVPAEGDLLTRTTGRRPRRLPNGDGYLCRVVVHY
jgi:hypothetical protein